MQSTEYIAEVQYTRSDGIAATYTVDGIQF